MTSDQRLINSYIHRLLPVVLIGALALTACSGRGDSGDGDKPVGTKEAWMAGNTSDAELDQVIARLARQCMETKGFSVHPPDQSSGEQWVFNPDEVITGDGSAITPPDAANSGYGMDPRATDPNPVPDEPDPSGEPGEPGEPGGPGDDGEDLRFYNELSEKQQSEYYVALDGIDKNKFLAEYYEKNEGKEGTDGEDGASEGEEPALPKHEQVTLSDGTVKQYPKEGCTAEVNAEVFTDGIAVYLEKEHVALDEFGTLIWEGLEQGEEMKALGTAWGACMAGRGFDGLDTPDDAYAKANEYYYGPTGTDGEPTDAEQPPTPGDADLDAAKAKEIKLAVAHVACDQETGYTTGKAALLTGALDTFLVEHKAELFGWYEYVTAALGTAKGLLKE